MIGWQTDEADRVNRYWDEVVGGGRSEIDGVAPALGAEVRRLHALDGAFAPEPAFLGRLQEELMGRSLAAPGLASTAIPHPRTSPDGRTSARRARWARRPLPARGWWPVGQAATVALLLVTMLTGYAAYRVAAPGSRATAPVTGSVPAIELYVSEDGVAGADRFVSLDPETLADQPDGPSINLGGPGWFGINAAVSADGSTVVGDEVGPPRSRPTEREIREAAAKDAVIVVWDGRSGAERTRFTLPFSSGALNGLRLSRDGSQLVVTVYPYSEALGPNQGTDPPGWHVVDTTDGRVLGMVPFDQNGAWHVESWIDPDARRLYRLFLPHWTDETTGPGPARLVAHDLTTGVEVGRLELPEVQGGTWATGRSIESEWGQTLQVIAELRPGVALSPDGQRFAFVYANEDAVTLVDAERLEVERTISLTQPAGIGERLLGLLPLVPRSAAAKSPTEGTVRRAVFAADGRHLYVMGNETDTTDDGKWTSRPMPMRVVDLDDGEIVTETSQGDWHVVHPSADGRSLYVAVSLPDEAGDDDDPPMLLRRLDPLTLAVRAERTFPGFPQLLLRPAVPNGSDPYGP